MDDYSLTYTWNSLQQDFWKTESCFDIYNKCIMMVKTLDGRRYLPENLTLSEEIFYLVAKAFV